MRQSSIDRALVATLLLVWAVCFGLALRSIGRPMLIPSVGIDADEQGGYPTVSLVAPWGGGDLERGDRLIRLGPHDLRGLAPLSYYARFQAWAEYGEPLAATYERGGAQAETLTPRPLLYWRPSPLLSLAAMLAALLLLLRAPPSNHTRVTVRGLLCWAIAVSPFHGGIFLNYLGLAALGLATSFSFPLCLRAVLLFSPRRESVWARFAPWLFALLGPAVVSAVAGWPLGLRAGGRTFQVGLVAFFSVLLIEVTRTYRAADAVGRRQLRWVLLGFYAGATPVIVVNALSLLDKVILGDYTRLIAATSVAEWFQVLIPASVVLAMVRYNLFDVDRLLSATASYNAVLSLLVGVGLVTVPVVGRATSHWLGFDPLVGQLAMSLALAAVVVPAQQRLRPHVDRLFFRERHDLQQGIAELLGSLSRCADARALVQRIGEELVRLLRPEACVVYAGAAQSFEPVFAFGRGIPPAFASDSALIATLRGRPGLLALSADGRRADAAALGPFDRAALEALRAEVVVPVRLEEVLVAFLCLGPKQSGDVYTSTDLSLLSALAETARRDLRRFDQEQTVRQAREMQDSLRRYVPGAVADQLASGIELAPEEREVSVLFVDLRGHTSLSESRTATEIFSTVNRYTEAVSSIVTRHAGAVVEFNGDGMMAVFGAPRDLPGKERAAVDAGRTILDAVSAIRVEGARETSLSAGVGIATGKACVGSIRGADRLIWSAIGNTTNLAARLQTLTRELDSSLVIDAQTWLALGSSREDFDVRNSVVIRGRSEPMALYCLRSSDLRAVSV